jgi:hypothetical protein
MSVPQTAKTVLSPRGAKHGSAKERMAATDDTLSWRHSGTQYLIRRTEAPLPCLHN